MPVPIATIWLIWPPTNKSIVRRTAAATSSHDEISAMS